MVILDTDHFTVLFQRGRVEESLRRRLLASADLDLAVSIVSVEESCRGWLAHGADPNRVRSEDHNDLLYRIGEMSAAVLALLLAHGFDVRRRFKTGEGAADLVRDYPTEIEVEEKLAMLRAAGVPT